MKKIFIIGGNSSFGTLLIKDLISKGYFVISTYNSSKIDIKDNNLVQYKLDLLNLKNIDNIFNEVFSNNEIDVFIFNSSIRKFGLLSDMSMNELDDFYKINIYSLQYIYKNYLFNYFREKKEGILLNIGSLGSLLSFPFSQTYCSSKAFQRSLIHGYDMELSKFCNGFKNIIFGPLTYNGDALINRKMLDENENMNKYFLEDLKTFREKYYDNIKGNRVENIVLEISNLIKFGSFNQTDILIGDDTKRLIKKNNILKSNNF